MKKTKEYKISVVLLIVALILFGVSILASLIPNFDYSIDKICMYLGFACFGFGLTYLKKSDNNK